MWSLGAIAPNLLCFTLSSVNANACMVRVPVPRWSDCNALVVQTGEEQWVAQKYIERPLVVLNRKFDIRQYVLVTSWNPLTIWFYNTSYLRFCGVHFSADLTDKFAHLSNNRSVVFLADRCALYLRCCMPSRTSESSGTIGILVLDQFF